MTSRVYNNWPPVEARSVDPFAPKLLCDRKHSGCQSYPNDCFLSAGTRDIIKIIYIVLEK